MRAALDAHDLRLQGKRAQDGPARCASHQRHRQIYESHALERGDGAHAMDRGAVSEHAQYWRHHHGHQSARQRLEQIPAELGLSKPVRGRCQGVSATCIVQSAWAGGRARQLDGGRDQESLPQVSRATGAGMRRLAMRAITWIPAMLVAAVGVAHAGGDPARGEKLYEDCVACHPIERSVHGIGPTLCGLPGRNAGEMADYRYSRALRDSGITWTAETLDTFIAEPQGSVPANRMPYAGMPDAADRADLIAYLQKVSK